MPLTPTGIASTVALGTPTLQHVIAPGGIASTAALGTPTLLSAVGSTLPVYSIFLNGVLVNSYIAARSIRRNLTIGGASRGTCQFTWLNTAATISSARPTVDDEVVIYEGATRFFGGTVESASERFCNGKPIMWVDVRCTDYGIVLDRRVIGKFYTLFMGGTTQVTISDIVTRFLAGTGISFDWPGTPDAYLGEQLFNYCTVAEAIQQIADKADADWSVDQYGVLRMFDKAAGTGAAPYTISDNDGNFDALTVTRSRAKRRNRQGVRNSRSNVALWTDTYTALAGDTSVETTYSQEVRPYVTLNGTSQTVVESSEIGGTPYDFYYVSYGIGVFRNQARPLGAGDVVVVMYPGKLPPVFWAEDAADIALHGRWEAVEEVKDITDPDAMQSIADGLLARGLEVPISVELQSRRAGWMPGKVVTVNTTQPLVSASLLIESVDSQEGEDNKFFRHTIRASNQQLQRTDRADNFVAKLIERGKQPIDRVTYKIGFTLAETIEGLTNPGLSVGVKPCIRVADKAGVIRDCTLAFKSVDDGTPTTADISIDVLKNGVSIFGTQKMDYPAGASGVQTQFIFLTFPMPVAQGDVFTVEVISADPLAMDGVIELVVLG